MRKKWVLLSFALGLGVILDVAPLQSQQDPGGKGGKGAKGERKAAVAFSYGQPPGGTGGGMGYNGGGAGYSGAGAGYSGGGAGYSGSGAMPPGGNFGGGKGGEFGGKGGGKGGEFGGGKGMDRGNFSGGPPGAGGNSGGGDRGNGGPPGAGRGGPDPEQSWRMLVGASGGTDTIKFDKLSPDTRTLLRRVSEKTGAPPMPETGEWNKEQFMAYATASAELVKLNQGGSMNGQGNSWGQGGNGDFDPRAMARGGKDREKKDVEEERPVAIRFGKLPKDSPPMFTDMDGDKDGQICLYEWRNSSAGGSILAFQEMDLNGDGLLTVEEYNRYTSMKTDRERAVAYENGETPPPKAMAGGRGMPGMTGRMPGGGGPPGMSFGPSADKSKDTSAKDEKRGAKDGGGKDGGGPGGRGAWGADSGTPRKK